MKIHVLGTSGSGKSTLARALAEKLTVPYIELDALHWGPNWTPKPEFIADTIRALDASESWVVCGNYGKAADEVLKRVEVIVWLDYPIYIPLYRVTLRSFKRALTREKLWAGNQESLREFFFGKESMFRWVLQSHGKRAVTCEALMADPSNAHIRWIRLKKLRSPETLVDEVVARLSS